jgi:hypothetical protein
MSPNTVALEGASPSLSGLNPPRRAKRARSPAVMVAEQAGSDSSPADDGDEGDDDDVYIEPKRTRTIAATTASAKGSRKHTKASRAARDAQRKANHSIIEKARRTKINDALATLSMLVPDKEHCESAGNGKENKEFKLEILLRTVDHLRLLTEKVKMLEDDAGCSKCSSEEKQSSSLSTPSMTTLEDSPPRNASNDTPSTPQVKRPLEDTSSSASSSSSSTIITPPTLPSISTWLPQFGVSLVCNPSGAGSGNNNSKSRLTSPFTPYLPSPPPSGSFRTPSNSINPPSLILPPPNLSHTSTTPPALGVSVTAGRGERSSPLMSPDDESAAAMLLQIKTSPLHRPRDAQRRRGSINGIEGPSSVRSSLALNESVDVMTPSSFLGI